MNYVSIFFGTIGLVRIILLKCYNLAVFVDKYILHHKEFLSYHKEFGENF